MTKTSSTHENQAHTDDVRPGSERAFGLVFSAVFAIIALFPLIEGSPIRIWSVWSAAVFLVVALAIPNVLKPLNIIWFKFGLILHKIVNPVIMGLLFFLTITPTGLIMRALRKDPLRLKKDPDAETYWISRTPPGPEPKTMKNQF